MPGFNSVRSMVNRELEGASVLTSWRKVPAVITSQGFWLDLSMSSGTPKPNYYASSPLVAARLAQSTDGGIFHGAPVAPGTKHLRKLLGMTVAAGAVPLPMMLCDYLLYYPFLDESLIDEEQLMDNSVALSRSVSGAGVQAMAVVVASHSVGTGTFVRLRYTNQSGVPNRVSQSCQLGNQFVNGTIATTAQARDSCFGPFIPLQSGDTGIRSIEGVTFSGVPDVGLVTIVLVKPLADISLRGVDAPVEVDYLIDRPSLPRVEDDAYLNFIAYTNGSVTGANILGMAEFAWST